jgi:hypothetical protein
MPQHCLISLRISGAAFLITFLLCGCGQQATATWYVPPSIAPRPPAGNGSPVNSPILSIEQTPSLTSDVVLPTVTPPCTDNLTYLEDLTVPDDSVMKAGQIIDKRWQVKNSGTCNWDERYGLKLISGDPMGVEPLQALYPARAGTNAVLRLLFIAPQEAGMYKCQWQAVNPDGFTFGDGFNMRISVAP